MINKDCEHEGHWACPGRSRGDTVVPQTIIVWSTTLGGLSTHASHSAARVGRGSRALVCYLHRHRYLVADGRVCRAQRGLAVPGRGSSRSSRSSPCLRPRRSREGELPGAAATTVAEATRSAGRGQDRGVVEKTLAAGLHHHARARHPVADATAPRSARYPPLVTPTQRATRPAGTSTTVSTPGLSSRHRRSVATNSAAITDTAAHAGGGRFRVFVEHPDPGGTSPPSSAHIPGMDSISSVSMVPPPIVCGCPSSTAARASGESACRIE
jgi:hypothetical protein